MNCGISATLQSDPGYYGLGWAKGVAYNRVRSLMPVYSSEWICFAETNAPIQTIRDLEGKRSP